jgi:uncharacterized protein (DUF2384 family)
VSQLIEDPSTINDLRADFPSATNELFGNDDKAEKSSLSRPLRTIDYKKPFECAGTPEMIRTLREVIGRQEHGVWT